MVTPLTVHGSIASAKSKLIRVSVAAMALTLGAGAAHAAPPKIRTDADNAVPRCVTPKRLMAFLKTRNGDLNARYADIASLYKRHGETWHVRWDYAFFQMAVETNFLTFKKGDGDWGDVNPKQNNFAGLGTTGGGVPGDSYPDVNTGVLAQIQHLVVYSGERIDNPVGARTKLKQDDIIETMAAKKGNVTFADLSRRWAADRHYGASIEWVASKYREQFCQGPDPAEDAQAAPVKKANRAAAAEPRMAAAANLGGPAAPAETAAEAPAEAKSAPVRTIWSADGNTAPEADASNPAPPASAPVARKVRLAPVPTRKPAVEASTEAGSPIVAEQIIQTGEDPQAALAATTQPSSTDVPPAATETASQPAAIAAAPTPEGAPHAFAYATAMGTTLSGAAAKPAGGCRVLTASYGGKKVLLVRSEAAAEVRYTVLTVLEGFERSMLDNYLKAKAPGGSSVGEFDSKDAALAKARELCPSAAAAPNGEGVSAG